MAECVEVSVVGQVVAAHDEGEELHAEDGVDEHAEREQPEDVDERWERQHKRHQQVAHPLGSLQQPQNTQHAEDPEHSAARARVGGSDSCTRHEWRARTGSQETRRRREVGGAKVAHRSTIGGIGR